MSATCERCGGTRHIKEREVWVQCSCVRKERLEAFNSTSGLGDLLNHGGWLNLNGGAVEALKRLDRSFSKALIVYGGEPAIRFRIAALMLQKFVVDRPKFFKTSLRALIDSKFTRNSFLLTESSRVDMLWLQRDFDRPHAWNESVFFDVMGDRADKFTVVTTPSNVEVHGLFPIAIVNAGKISCGH